MPNEDDKIGDLSKQLEETSIEDDSNHGSTGTATEESNSTTETKEKKTSNDQANGPPFTFDETDMHGFYVRDSTWEGVARTRSAVAAVCSTFGVSEFEGREFQDACLQVVSDQGAEVALKILEEREIEADEERVTELIEVLMEQPTE
jgi:hypothetical protein